VGLLATPLTPEASRAAILRFGLGTGAYLVAIGVAFVAPLVLVIAGAITASYIFERVPTGPTGVQTPGPGDGVGPGAPTPDRPPRLLGQKWPSTGCGA